MTNKKFEKELTKWAVKLNIGDLYFCKDNSLPYAACVSQCQDKKKPLLEYNLRSINSYNIDYHSIIFHEFGHIVYKHYLRKSTTMSKQIVGEYEAEKYSDKMMDKYFPKKIKTLRKRKLEIINNEDWAEEWPIHSAAFGRIYR